MAEHFLAAGGSGLRCGISRFGLVSSGQVATQPGDACPGLDHPGYGVLQFSGARSVGFESPLTVTTVDSVH